jgi:glutaredoxin
MPRVTFFTKPDCGLCNAAMYVIERVRRWVPFEFESIDITAPGQEKWLDRYREHIPVVHLNGREVFRHRVDEKELRRLLGSAGATDQR